MTLQSPYLQPGRFGDLVAAIQTMGAYEFYRRDAEQWAIQIAGDASKANAFENMFAQHPELFRKSRDRSEYALVWRRALPSRYDRRTRDLLTKDQYEGLPAEERVRYVTRPPLTDAQIKTLIDVATALHSRALEHSRDWRWFVQPFLAMLAAFVGAGAAIVAARLKTGG